MSWLRWMSLASFRHHNPDWEIELHVPRSLKSVIYYRTAERDDSQYGGADYLDRLDEIGVKRFDWHCPHNDATPAQASDIFQWDMLGRRAGFYSDMDILWTAPLEPLRGRCAKADAVFCLEAGLLAIGFFASNRCKLFTDLYHACFKYKKHGRGNYQGYGTQLLYMLLRMPGTPQMLRDGTAGIKALEVYRDRYPTLRIDRAPDATVYPFDWREIPDLFKRAMLLPPGTVGIHWFGGSPLAQRWNRRLTEQNWRNHPENTLTQTLRWLS